MYIKCSVVATKISEIIDHEASFMTRLRFYSHLMMCSKCRDYFRQFKLLKETARQHEPEALPNDFDSVMDFVMEEIEAKDEKVT
ncbi:MAG: zf-HC2 domain-containing protein [Emcibacteraceae bacterium]|nr:zf-HC2 domain-containing protein [Emcibacteraceae bacterium]